MGVRSFFSETVENQSEFKEVFNVGKTTPILQEKNMQKKELEDIIFTIKAVYLDRCQNVIIKISVLKLSGF